MHDDTLTDLEEDRYGRLPRRRRSLSSGGAIFHLRAGNGSRGGGQSARAAAAYIQREAEYRRDQGEELVYTESGHMPAWAAAAPTTYWDAADLYERANGQLFKRVEVALPLALTEAEQRELAVGFAHHLTDGERLPYTLAIHAGNGTNPHCHLLISERGNDGLERAPEQWFKRYNAAAPEQGGARKSRALQPKAWLLDAREAWAAQTNAALERAGHAVRIDHRSLEAQGIERLPSLHLGPTVAAMEARGIKTARGTEARRRAQVNAELAALHSQQEDVRDERARPGPEREPGGAGAEREGGDVGGRAGRLAARDRGERGPSLGDGSGARRGAAPERSAGLGTGAPDVAARDAEPAPEPHGPDRPPGPADRALRSRERPVGADLEPGAVAAGRGERERDPGGESAPAGALLVDGATGAGPGGVEDLSRDVGGYDPDPAGGGQPADTGGGHRQVAAPAAQAPAQERARRLIEAGQEKARQEKRQQKREREQARERQRSRERDDFDRER